ncbi:sulfate adenylyltransferase [Candidatus Parcubacteria bacterium]|nr:MAG: sulfate adenylyltransferase [Candidatus Parcubacteria bacterium]
MKIRPTPKKTKIVVTLGPSTHTKDHLRALKDRGVGFVRVNMSHSSIADQGYFMKLARDVGIPFILDTEGSQVRNGANERGEIRLEEGARIKIYQKQIRGNSTRICLKPESIVPQLAEGDLVYIDFNSVVLRVTETSMLAQKGYVVSTVLSGGIMGANKGVVIDTASKKNFELPTLSPKDEDAIAIALKEGVDHIAVSFVRSPEAVDLVRKRTKSRMKIISKIECTEALEQLDAIIEKSDYLLIDRGDLSREVPIEKIPFAQKIIIDRARKKNKGVFVATNFLESMVHKQSPTRAEVHDTVQTILDGAFGVTLAAETAIGDYPIEVVNTLNKLIHQAESVPEDARPRPRYVVTLDKANYLHTSNPGEMLIPPNGGTLVDRQAAFGLTPDGKLQSIQITDEQHMDIEQIAIGTFSPLEGFLTHKELDSVLKHMRMPSGAIWPMPIVLDVSTEEAARLTEGSDIALKNKKGTVVAVLHLKEKYAYDKKDFAQHVYGTTDPSHPGVAMVLAMRPVFLGGTVTLYRRYDSPTKKYELTPRQTRRLFAERGWSRIVAFHTRNAIHRGHEFIQLEALRRSSADGLFIHPVIGKKKKGDFEAEAIIAAYALMSEQFYPKGRAILGTFASYSRYAGPREALFTALCRQNFGCSHFIVGRDHTGIGSFYPPAAAHEIFDRFPDLNISPVRFNQVFYSSKEKKHIHEGEQRLRHKESEKLNISGTQVRAMLLAGKKPPAWFMRPEISSAIIDMIKRGKKVFVE